MEIRVLLDTNVLLDYILMREPYFEYAQKIVSLCTDGSIQGCIAAHSIPNMFFILWKDFSFAERRELLIGICAIFDIEGIDKNKLVESLNNEKFSDFEDCIQMECAKEYGAHYIVTRNVADYEFSDIIAIEPKDFIKEISNAN